MSQQDKTEFNLSAIAVQHKAWTAPVLEMLGDSKDVALLDGNGSDLASEAAS